MKHKVVKLIPTDISLEIFIGKKKDIVKKLKKYKGKKKSYWKDMVGNSSCAVGMPDHIYMFLLDTDIQTIVHEAVHATWHLDDIVDFGFDSHNQEIQAYYVDYIVGKVMKMK